MVRVIMIVGPSGTGKSTYAKILCEKLNKRGETCIILSSDALRAELWGDENDQRNPKYVFNVLYQRMYKALAEGKSVIIDATNLLASRRKSLVTCIHRTNPDYHCHCRYLDVPLKIALARNQQRNRVVPEKVIRRQYDQYEVPTEEEGWDYISRVCPYSFVYGNKTEYEYRHYTKYTRSTSEMFFNGYYV